MTKKDSSSETAKRIPAATSSEAATTEKKPGGTAEGKTSNKDIALICGTSEDGSEVAILRQRDERLEAGILRKLEHGKPIDGEVLRLRKREGSPVCDVETLLEAPAHLTNSTDTSSPDTAADLHSGSPLADRGHPAQVSNETYRSGWDAIWNQPGRDKLLN